jgi:hypothetical protein
MTSLLGLQRLVTEKVEITPEVGLLNVLVVEALVPPRGDGLDTAGRARGAAARELGVVDEQI